MARRLGFLLLQALLATQAICREVDFDDIFVDDPDLDANIPKISHFVFSEVKPLSWLEYASIKSTYTYLGVEKINIWVPKNTTFVGEVWKETLAIKGATVREIEMPSKIYGNDVGVLAHVSDIVRLEALYNEGGIYMDYNAIALKSWDDIIAANDTKDTVMGRELAGLCNAIYMTKKQAPFMRNWMAEYKNFKDEDWMGLSVNKPWELYDKGGQDLTVLSLAAWFYPTFLDAWKTWIGHSWARDIQRNYAVHMWGTFRAFYPLLTPEVVREIDTPLFCRVRPMFDNVGSKYISTPEALNPNCSFVTMDTLVKSSDKLMGRYEFVHDSNIKMVDTSGNRLHGWAPVGTSRPLEDGVTVREFRKGDHAYIPVPYDYDGRKGAISTDIMFQVNEDSDKYITFTKLRMDNRDVNLFWRFIWHSWKQEMEIELQWTDDREEKNNFKIYRYIPYAIDDDRYHSLHLSWDRLELGLLSIHVDGKEIARESVSLVERYLSGEDLWVNSINEDESDMNLRARLRSLSTYAAANFDRTVKTGSSGKGGAYGSDPLYYRLGFASYRAFKAWALFSLTLIGTLATVVLRNTRTGRRVVIKFVRMAKGGRPQQANKRSDLLSEEEHGEEKDDFYSDLDTAAIESRWKTSPYLDGK